MIIGELSQTRPDRANRL